MVIFGKISKVGNSNAINLKKKTCDDKKIEVGDEIVISIGNTISKRKVIQNKNCKAITLKKKFCKRLDLDFRDEIEYEILSIEKNVENKTKDEFVGATVR